MSVSPLRPGPVHHVALVADTAYVPWCAVAIWSCLDQMPASSVVVHLLHDGSIDQAARTALAAMVEGCGSTLNLHQIGPEATEHLPALDRFGRIVWLRFLLPELLEDVDRVLYLDADTLVVASLEPLLATDLKGAPVAAVANVMDAGGRTHVHTLGIADPNQFFNSGVLLMDLAAMRAERSTGALLKVAVEKGQALRWPDQDALNIVFDGRWHALHPRWNAQNSLWGWRDEALAVFGAQAVKEATIDPAVVHFEGPMLCKPWHYLNRHVWRERYWQVLRSTPWADTQEEDHTLATRIIALLPNNYQEEVFLHLARWRVRQRRGA